MASKRLSTCKALVGFAIFLQLANPVNSTELSREVGGVRLKIPTVAGLTNVAENAKSAALAAAATDPNALFVAGLATANFDKYILVMLPKFMEQSDMSQGEFTKMVDQMRGSSKNLARFAQLANDQFLLERDRISAATQTNIIEMKFGVPYFVERVHDGQNRFGDTTITHIQGNIGGKRLDYNALICSPLVRLKGKVFVLKVISIQPKPEDAVWVRDVCKSFVDNLISAN